MTKNLIVAVGDQLYGRAKKEYVFRASPVSVGSDPCNGLVLPADGVLPYHGLLFFSQRAVRFLAFPLTETGNPDVVTIETGESLQVGALLLAPRLAEAPGERRFDEDGPLESPLALLDRELIGILCELTAALRAIPKGRTEIIAMFARRAVGILDTISTVLSSATPEGVRALRRSLHSIPLLPSTARDEVLDYLLDIRGEQASLDAVRDRVVDLLRQQVLAALPSARA